MVGGHSNVIENAYSERSRNMKRKKVAVIFPLVIALMFVLSGCGQSEISNEDQIKESYSTDNDSAPTVYMTKEISPESPPVKARNISTAAEPDMHDIGILASFDPVALDQACVDLVYAAEDGDSLVERIESRNGLHTLEQAEKIGLGSRSYNLVNVND